MSDPSSPAMTSRRRGYLAMPIAAMLSLGAVTGVAQARPDDPMRPAPHSVASAAYHRMTAAQRVGQLFMAGIRSTGASASTISMLVRNGVGNVVLDGDSTRSRRALRRDSAHLAARLSVAGVGPFISTDQEGGAVQRLTGRGFSRMPTALEQGHLHPSVLKSAAAKWGLQLHTAGVNLDLAPVADTVPAKHASSNQPIGQFDREFGHRPPVVAAHAVAFLRGMNAAGVDATVKHFPGLGRATGNTDTSRHVTDPTTAHDRYLLPFRKAIRAGAEFVMVSSATYPRIDKHHPACFSARVMTTLLRGELNFRGAVISDDLGVTALSRTPVRARAVRFFAAGGTMLLDTSLSQIPGMIRAVLAKQRAHTAFARTIKQAVMTDLTAKANAGLL